MALCQYASPSKLPDPPATTEFDLLKASHRFLREEDEKDLTWEDQMAKKYYASLYREFAVCDLKHYKTGNFALRWRTEREVLSGAGEETCGNSRCAYHEPSRTLRQPPLKTLELPFVYEEQGNRKSALVKIVLCDRCVKKLMWKREKEKEAAKRATESSTPARSGDHPSSAGAAVSNGGSDKKRTRMGDKDAEQCHKRRRSHSPQPMDTVS